MSQYQSINGAETSITQPSSIQVQEEPHTTTSLKPLNPDISHFNFQQYTTSKTTIINVALEIAVPLQNPVILHEAMRQSLLRPGDNRIRALLCLAACDLLGGDESTAIPIACAMEMIHSFADINADLRSNSQRGSEEVAKHLGSGSLLSLAFKNVAARTGNVGHPQLVVRVIAELASVVGSKGFVAGELADLCSEGKGDVGVAELKYIHVCKTARVFEAAVVCGAIMGGGDGAEVERLRMYGRYIGLLSEVVNDIVEATKSSEKTKKKMVVGKGLVRNTATYPGLMGLEKATVFAEELEAKAMEELSHFDAFKAAPLYHFVHYVASGQN